MFPTGSVKNFELKLVFHEAQGLKIQSLNHFVHNNLPCILHMF